MNEHFNTDGALPISPESFEKYQHLFDDQQPDFDYLVQYWLDERNPDDLRRLAIRDILRQDLGHNPHAYFQTNSGYARLLILLQNKEDPQYHAGLLYRPKLINELAEELMYAIKNDHLVRDYYSTSEGDVYLTRNPHLRNDACNDLIRFLLPLASATIGLSLLSYHTTLSAKNMPDDEIQPTLHLIVDTDNCPEWLRTELWNRIRNSCYRQTDLCQKTFQNHNHLQDVPYSHPADALRALANFISLYAHAPNREQQDYAPLTQIISFLNAHLPPHLGYSPAYDLFHIAPFLADDYVALAYANRHVMHLAAGEDIASPAGRRFLYWLRGLASALAPDNTALILQIDTLINNIPRPQPATQAETP